MNDIRKYGEQELSLNVMNDEYLYTMYMRCKDLSDLRKLADANFRYTAEQFEELHADLREDLKS